jgi:hypothetical protein
MSNIFRFTSVTYFQTPESLIETGVWAKLTPSAKDLYMLLLYRAQKTSSETLTLTAADAGRVGLHPNSVKAARENLIEHKLITATRARDGYTLELLNPTGGSLQRIEDVTKVDPEIVEEYFLERLAAYDVQEHHYQALEAHCPFHESMKGRKHPLHITCIDGGAFKCHQCDVSGGIVDFEIAMSARDGSELDRNRAYSKVRDAFVTAARKRERRKAEDMVRALAML